MRHRFTMYAIVWAALTVASLLAVTTVRADEPRSKDEDQKKEELTEKRDSVSSFWLGIGCEEVDESLRAQLDLPENQGLVVHGVAPESPAAKSGIREHDVLLKVGDKALRKVGDLAAAVKAAGEKELTIEILRGGKSMTVTAKPEKRPEAKGLEHILPHGAEWDELGRLLDRDWGDEVERGLGLLRRRLEPGEDRDVLLWRFGPGMLIREAFPDDLSVTITKKGKEPAKVVVEKGSDRWEATSDDLDKLPKEVRPHIERLLGRPPGVAFVPRPRPPVRPEGEERPDRPERPRRADSPYRPERPDGPIPPDDRGARERRFEEEVEREVERRLAPMRDRIREFVESRQKEFGAHAESLEKAQSEFERRLNDRRAEMDKALGERAEQLEKLFREKEKVLRELLERLPKSTDDKRADSET